MASRVDFRGLRNSRPWALFFFPENRKSFAVRPSVSSKKGFSLKIPAEAVVFSDDLNGRHYFVDLI
jgi:hypothetical protein